MLCSSVAVGTSASVLDGCAARAVTSPSWSTNGVGGLVKPRMGTGGALGESKKKEKKNRIKSNENNKNRSRRRDGCVGGMLVLYTI